MVKVVAPDKPVIDQALPQVLYIGKHADELRPALALVEGLAITFATSMEFGLERARGCRFDFILLDQRDPAFASRHVARLAQGLGYEAKLVVVSPLASLGAYLRVPGVAAVLAAPMRPHHVLRVLGLTASGLSWPELRNAS